MTDTRKYLCDFGDAGDAKTPPVNIAIALVINAQDLQSHADEIDLDVGSSGLHPFSPGSACTMLCVEPGETTITGPSVVRTRLPDAFTARFAGLYASAFQAAYRLLGDREEADDVAQEACARACLRWDRLSKHGIQRPWIVRKATDLAIRRYQRRQRAEVPAEVPAEVTERVDERRDALHRALSTLPRRRRKAVVLRYIAELSEDDAADALNWSPATVGARATRGIAALRDALGEVAR